MRPKAPVREVLVVFQQVASAMKHGSFTFEANRSDPLLYTTIKDGLLKYRLTLGEDGKLLGWERFTYLQVDSTFSSAVEAGRYHEVKFLDGVYDARSLTRLVQGFNVNKPVDMELPTDL